jgi:hypothetical protein
MRTIAEVQAAIEERGTTVMIQMVAAPGPPWVVWLYAFDDPDISAHGTGADLAAALDSAVTEWDEPEVSSGEEPPQKPEPN